MEPQPTVGANSIAVTGKEQTGAMDSLGNGALAFKWGLHLCPKH